jgi:hypothetical protein
MRPESSGLTPDPAAVPILPVLPFDITARMAGNPTRREMLLALTASAGMVKAEPTVSTVETHVHLFDPARVPYAPNAPYTPAAYTLGDHLTLVRAAGLAHSIIVHPEPYQDDHRYVEYCLAHEPSPGYFKATCMFDPLREETPRRMRELTERWPGRIVALRIHEMSMTPESSGPIRNRDMKDPRMNACWNAVASMGWPFRCTSFLVRRPRFTHWPPGSPKPQ